MFELIERYIQRLLSESTPQKPIWNIENIVNNREPRWNYVDGCMLTALLSLGEISNDSRYFEFVKSFADWYVFEDGTLRGYEKEKYALDDVNEGRILFDLYTRTREDKYRKAIELLHTQLVEQPRTKEGSFWHKAIYPNQVWLDGLYMAQVFSVRYAAANGGDKETVADVVRQFENARALMFDEAAGLYRHGYDSSKTAFWADANGLSASFWLRAEGWFLVGLADCIGYLKDKKARAALSAILLEALDGLLPYRDRASGMFSQVADKKPVNGNYPETSGTAMVAYALLKGAREKALPPEYAAVGASIFDSICRTALRERDGRLNLSGICLVSGLGPQGNTRRDGSYRYYTSEPVVENDAKGVAPFLMAYAELKRM